MRDFLEIGRVAMSDSYDEGEHPRDTRIDFEVLGPTQTQFRVTGNSGPTGWLGFNIRQPKYPRPWVPIDIVRTQPEEKASALAAWAANWIDGKWLDILAKSGTRRTLPSAITATLLIHSREKPTLETGKFQIGTLEYWENWTVREGRTDDGSGDEGYRINLHLLPKDFDRIQDLMLAGRQPSLITIYTRDILFDYVLDNRQLIWPVVARFPQARIVDAAFEYEFNPLAVTLVQNEYDVDLSEKIKSNSQIFGFVRDIFYRTEHIDTWLRAIFLFLLSSAIGLFSLIIVVVWYLKH